MDEDSFACPEGHFALIAVGLHKKAVIVKCCPCLSEDAGQLGYCPDELGIDYPDEPGLYIWTGTSYAIFTESLDGADYEVAYSGTCVKAAVGDILDYVQTTAKETPCS